MAFEIQKSVPMPEQSVGKVKYPFPDMEVGDSFWAPLSTEKLSNATGHWREKLGHKYSVRPEEGEHEGQTVAGARVWRTA